MSQGTDTLKPDRNAINRHGSPRSAAVAQLDNPFDWFIEEEWCVDVLLDQVPGIGSQGQVLDPACGCGTMVERMRQRGVDAVGSDIVDRGYLHCRAGIDFTLMGGGWGAGAVADIVSNPPYYGGKGPVAFMEAGLRVARRSVSLLVGLPFLASQGRYPLFTAVWPISHVIVFSQRPSMPPGELLVAGAIEAKGGKEDFIWVVATHGHSGPPQLFWGMGPPETRERRSRSKV